MVYYCVYKITNTISGKIYIGTHTTTDLNDSYMGSGLLIKKAIDKYGVDSFLKEYIKLCNTRDEMLELESHLVNESFVKSENTYNMCCGGKGGCPINNIRLQIKNKERLFRKKLEYYNAPKRCQACSMPIEFKCRNINKFCNKSCSAAYNNKRRGRGLTLKSEPGRSSREKYNLESRVCMQCNTPISYEKRRNSFCNRTCKAQYTNHNRYKNNQSRVGQDG